MDCPELNAARKACGKALDSMHGKRGIGELRRKLFWAVLEHGGGDATINNVPPLFKCSLAKALQAIADEYTVK